MRKSNRHHKEKQIQSLFSLFFKKIGLSNIISIISVLIAGVALYLAWQANALTREANEISLKQVSEQLIITRIIHLGGHQSNSEGNLNLDENSQEINVFHPDYIFCSHKIRLSNLGESPTAVVNFSVSASYRDNLISLEGFGEALTFYEGGVFFQSLPIKVIQSVLISEEMSRTVPLDEKWLNNSNNGIDLPISIPNKSSLDFVVHTIIAIDHSNSFFEGKDILVTYPYKSDIPEDIDTGESYNILRGFYPFKVTYIFETVAGQIITTNPFACWDIGVFPSGTIENYNLP